MSLGCDGPLEGFPQEVFSARLFVPEWEVGGDFPGPCLLEGFLQKVFSVRLVVPGWGRGDDLPGPRHLWAIKGP